MAKEMPNNISDAAKKRRADRDAKIADVVSGRAGVKIPIEKMSEAKADIYKKAGIVGEGGKGPRVPKQSTFNRPLRGAKPTGGAQHDRTNSMETEDDIRTATLSKEMDTLRHGAAAQLSASGSVLGQPKTSKTGRIDLAAHHAGKALQAATNVSMNPRQRRDLTEGHRTEVHRTISQMTGEERRLSAGMQVPCSTPGCKNMSVRLEHGSCAGEGGSCSVSPSITSADLRRPRSDV